MMEAILGSNNIRHTGIHFTPTPEECGSQKARNASNQIKEKRPLC
jgi:hypothetical protein